MILSLDLETECGVSECTKSDCKHALTPHLARITVVGVWSPSVSRVFRDLGEFQVFLYLQENLKLVGHNLKFDLRMLRHHGVDIPDSAYEHDTMLMAVADYNKIPADWLETYNAQAKILNKRRSGTKHRPGGPHGLKTLAPYLLGVEAFWEPETGHDNDDYVLVDCEYSYRLWEYYTERLKQIGVYEFYAEKLMPWNKMFLTAEERGVSIDVDLIKQEMAKGIQDVERLAKEIQEQWAGAFADYAHQQKMKRIVEIVHQEQAAAERLKNPTPEKLDRIKVRHLEKMQKARQEPEEVLNLDSPAQLKWLLRDHLKLDVCDLSGKESTGVEVLEKLVGEGREDVKKLLDYRGTSKLVSAFYPKYLELQNNGILHTSFQLGQTKTGRTSSSNPNCFSMDTEILTDSGWKTFDKLERRDTVAQFDRDSGTIVFEEPESIYISENAPVDMVGVKNQHLDYRFTSNHRCLFRDRKTGSLVIKQAESWLKDAQVLHGAPSASPGLGISQEWIQLAVAIQADASLTSSGRLDFSFTKLRKIDRLKDILDKLKVTYKISASHTKTGVIRHRFLMSADHLPVWRLLDSQKRFSSGVLALSYEELKIFVEELRYWDGLSTRKNTEYVSKQEQNADIVQAAASLCGIRAHKVPYKLNGCTYYRVYMTPRSYSLTSNCEVTRKQTVEKVGCVKTRLGLILVRRGPDPIISGNCQQVPSNLHRIFIARPGYKLITKDLSAIEPRLIAFYSEDEILCRLMIEGGDFHSYNAKKMFKADWPIESIKAEHKAERDMAKEVGLAVLYGAGKNRVKICATKRGVIWSDRQCQEAVDGIRKGLPGVAAFKKRLDLKADKGETITNLFGRRRCFKNDKQNIYMQAFNSLIQSSGSDLLIHSSYKISERFRAEGIDGHLLMTVHDECVFEVREDQIQQAEHIIESELTSYKLDTPYGAIPLFVEGNVSDTWSK